MQQWRGSLNPRFVLNHPPVDITHRVRNTIGGLCALDPAAQQTPLCPTLSRVIFQDLCTARAKRVRTIDVLATGA